MRLETVPRFLQDMTYADHTSVADDLATMLSGSDLPYILELCGSNSYGAAIIQSYVDLHSVTELMEERRDEDAKTEAGIFLSDLIEVQLPLKVEFGMSCKLLLQVGL